MYIKSVHIQNIRSIRELKMSFGDDESKLAGWHVLIGENGSGKTTILRCIAMGLMTDEDLSVAGINSNELLKDDGDNQGAIDLNFSLDWAYDIANEKGIKESLSNDAHRILSDDQRELGSLVLIFRNHRRNTTIRSSISFEKYDQEDNITNSGPLGGIVFGNVSSGFFSCGFGPFRRFKGGNDVWNQLYESNPRVAAHMSLLGEDVALTQIEPWLKELDYEEAKRGKKSLSLKNLKVLLNERELLPDGVKLHDIGPEGLTFTDANGATINLHQLSDGYRSVLSMTMELIRQLIRVYGEGKVFADIEQGEKFINLPGVVLIDEVDAHLHPSWQVKIGEWFTAYFPKLQFIVTTHSPLVCRAAEKGTIWKLPALGTGQVEEVVGRDKNKLIYGDLLDAVGTDLFGREASQSEKSLRLEEELANLETTELFRALNTGEKKRLKELKALF